MTEDFMFKRVLDYSLKYLNEYSTPKILDSGSPTNNSNQAIRLVNTSVLSGRHPFWRTY